MKTDDKLETITLYQTIVKSAYYFSICLLIINYVVIKNNVLNYILLGLIFILSILNSIEPIKSFIKYLKK